MDLLPFLHGLHGSRDLEPDPSIQFVALPSGCFLKVLLALEDICPFELVGRVTLFQPVRVFIKRIVHG